MLLHGHFSVPFQSPLRLRSTVIRHLPRKFPFAAAHHSYAISDDASITRIHPPSLNRRPKPRPLKLCLRSRRFPKRDTDEIKVALEHADSLLWVEYEKTNRPVAFARATGDGLFNAIIWDVVVDPTFQGIGLGKVERVVAELRQKGITNIALYSEPRVLGIYRPLGFV